MFRYPRERDFVVVTFDQDYRSSSLSNVMRKRQYWVKEGARWKIIYEGAGMKLQASLHPFRRRGRSPRRRARRRPAGRPARPTLGTIRLELYPAKAPKTVENFLQYVKDGHYNGTIFHRVIDGFMIQGGGFDKQHEQKPTRAPIQNEAKNGLKNDIGTLAMARTSDPHSATAQFFINVKNNDFLNYPAARTAGATRCSARWCRAWTW